MNDRFPDYSVEEMYPAIARALVRCLPEAWQAATLTFEWLAADAVNSNATYIDGTGKEQWVLSLRPGSPIIPHMFVSLAARMEEAAHPRWQKAIFSLDFRGHFALDLIYPPEEEASVPEGDG